ncbi:hypothetical protein NUW58_g2398 [Xylaria curta]|uniref:Uncharacterized protein n=1 Tax=Xylaria curta TaxID=42375 RepID=A0ACC1PGA2_9PEZI|nr:hypothetical protein NUW58_g2398 [Xylaria curta]
MSDQDATADALNSSTSKKQAISDLEDRYIKLLEAKVAHLESQLTHRKLEQGSTVETFGRGFVRYGAVLKGVQNSSSYDEADAETTLPKSLYPGHIENSEENGEGAKKESRYHMVLTEWDPRKGKFEEQSLPDIENTLVGPVEKPNRAFTFRKITGVKSSRHHMIDNDLSSSSEVDVVFPELQKLLGRLTSKWGWSEDVTQCASPYLPLVYSWDQAQKESIAIVEGESDDEKQARNDLKELLRIISTSSGDVRLDRYFKDRQALLSEGTITHEALWTLFPPGTLIVGRPCNEESQIFVAESCDIFTRGDDTFELICYSFDWNGTVFSRVPFEIEIEAWGRDRKSVTSLPFYPLEFHEENGLSREESIQKLKTRLIERGKKFVSCCIAEKGKQMFNYSNGGAYFHRGGTLLQRTHTDSSIDLEDQQRGSSSVTSDDRGAAATGPGASWKSIEGAVIVDFASFLTYQSSQAPILGPLERYEGPLTELSPSRRAQDVFKNMYKFDWDRHPAQRPMSDEQLLCCPPRVLGYALKQKTWVQLLVKHLDPPNKADASTFNDQLQLGSDAKDLILKSVQAHAMSDKRSQGLDDFAPGKGKGLVIMLSWATRRGQNAHGRKCCANDKQTFAFLTKQMYFSNQEEKETMIFREMQWFQTVLLRVLEYYDGILILTTNRMRSLDIAVQSRIHLAIKFKELSQEQRANIYISFLEQLDNKGLVDDFTDLKAWATKDSRRVHHVTKDGIEVGPSQTRIELSHRKVLDYFTTRAAKLQRLTKGMEFSASLSLLKSVVHRLQIEDVPGSRQLLWDFAIAAFVYANHIEYVLAGQHKLSIQERTSTGDADTAAGGPGGPHDTPSENNQGVREDETIEQAEATNINNYVKLLIEFDKSMQKHHEAFLKIGNTLIARTYCFGSRTKNDEGWQSKQLARVHWSNFHPTVSQLLSCRSDFLSLAVQFGLLRYVSRRLGEGSNLVRTKKGMPLLQYALCTFSSDNYELITVEMAKKLLEHGARPNDRFRGRTCWEAVLAWEDQYFESFSRNRALREVDRYVKTHLEIFGLLLENGANPRAQYCLDAREKAMASFEEFLTKHFQKHKDVDPDAFNTVKSKASEKRNESWKPTRWLF